jgi:hypothetical protein
MLHEGLEGDGRMRGDLNEIKHRDLDESTLADVRYTPSGLARQLIEITTLQGKSILDPCSGKGAFFNAFPDDMERFECEIKKGANFYDWNKPVDWVVSNPPFSQLTKWLEHTLNVAEVGFAYVMPTYSLTYQRLKMIESFGFYCEKTVIIENPKEWEVGFAMAYYIFKKNGSRATRLIEGKQPIQTRLW